MKVLIYAHGFAPVVGGAEKYVMLLADGLAKQTTSAFAVTVVTPTPAGGFDDSQLAFKVIRQPSILALARLIHGTDVIQLSGPCLLPLLLSWILRRPAVIEHHGYTASCPNGLLLYEPDPSVCPEHFMEGRYEKCLRCVAFKEGRWRSIYLLLWSFPRRWLCQRAAVNVPITHHVATRLRLPRSKVIYYGISDSTDTSRPADDLRQDESSPCFAYVGRLVPLKGLTILVEAAKRLKDQGHPFRLKFVGDGPQRAELQALVADRQLDKEVEFVGFATGEHLREELSNISAVIMPSIWEETAGLAAIEQLMRGQLVIAADIGGLGEVVGEAGMKCKPGDAASLASCMKRAIEHPEIIQRLGKVARERALSLFRQDKMVDAYAKLYHDLAEFRRDSDV